MTALRERAAWWIAAAVLVAALVGALWPSGAASAPGTPPQPSAPLRTPAEPTVGNAEPATAGAAGEHGDASLRTTPAGLPAAAVPAGEPVRELSVLVLGLPAGITELPVTLVYADERTGQWAGTMLFVGGVLPMTLGIGDGPRRPSHVDFAFPTTGRSMREIGTEPRFVLDAPALGSLEVEVLGADGQPLDEPARLDVRAPVSPWPASRWHSRVVPAGQPRASLRVEVGTGQLELRATTQSGRTGTAWATGPIAAGQTVSARVWLAAAPERR